MRLRGISPEGDSFLLGIKTVNGVPSSSEDLSDSTAVGRAVLTAESAEDAARVIGAVSESYLDRLSAFRNTDFDPSFFSGLDLWFDAGRVGGRVLASDGFGRADSGSLGTSSSGHVYTQFGGAGLSISGGQVTGTGNAVINTGLSDGSVEMVFLASSAVDVQVYPRYVDADNFVVLNLSSSYAQLAKKLSGTSSQIAYTAFGSNLVAGRYYRVRLEYKGAAYKVYLQWFDPASSVYGNDDLVVDATDSGSNFLNSTWQGFGKVSSTHTINDFNVSSLDLVDGDLVAVWPNAAGAGSAKQSTVAQRPIFKTVTPTGTPAVLFDGSNDSLPSDVSAADATQTLFAVIDVPAYATASILGAGNGGMQLRVNTDGSMSAAKANTAGIGTSSGDNVVPLKTACVVAFVYDGGVGRYQFYIDGLPLGRNPAPSVVTFSSANAIVGALTGSEYFNGRIYEILRYNRCLRGDEIFAVTAGLTRKHHLVESAVSNSAAALAIASTGLATLTGSEVLTNKTVTNGKFNALKDTNGNTSLLLTATANAVNYIEVINGVAGAFAVLRAAGSDSAIPLILQPKGAEATYIRDGNGVPVTVFEKSSSPVNSWIFRSSNAGSALVALASGSSSAIDIDIQPKGSGKLKAGGVDVALVSGSQTLTQKTLTSPVLTDPQIGTGTVSYIKDSSGNNMLALGKPSTSAVNYMQFNNSGAGGYPGLYAVGSDSNVPLIIQTQGTASLYVANGGGESDDVKIRAVGNTNKSLDLVSNGSGTVKVNGNPAGVKVAVPGSSSTPGKPGQWAADSSFIYAYTGDGTTHTWVRASAGW